MNSATNAELVRRIAELELANKNLEGDLQLSEEALHFARKDAERYRVVREHAADVTPDEMDKGADAIIAARAAAKVSA